MKRSAKLVVLALVPLLLGAVPPGDGADSPHTRLSLTGQGYASETVEFVTVSAAVQTFSKSGSRAVGDNATDMDRLRARLVQKGVGKDDFRTANFRFQKGRDPDDEDGERDEGFVVQHQLSIVVRDTKRVGNVMDALVAAGATDLSLDRQWGYSREVSPAALKQARAGAIRDAQAKANDYASALGMRIRRVVSITDQGGYSRDQTMAHFSARAPASATVIETRPAMVLSAVGMVFELEQ